MTLKIPRTKMTSNGVMTLLDETHTEALEKTDRLYELLTKLRYEGKFLFGRNLKEVRTLLRFFHQKLSGRMRSEERLLFPFLEVHVPKVAPVLRLLRSGGEDFRRNLRALHTFLGKLARTRTNHDYAEAVDQVIGTGTYLVYLVRHYIRLERKSISKVIQKELRADERAALNKRFARRRFLTYA